MRFFTGMYSEQLNNLERELFRAIDAQRGKREAVQKIREFMIQFGWATDVDLAAQIETANAALREAEAVKRELDSRRQQQTHPTDALRERLREIGRSIDATRVAIGESEEGLREQVALRGELITARLKAERTSQAAQVLQGVEYERCPQCGTDIRTRPHRHDQCGLCLSDQSQGPTFTAEQLELIRRDFNERIDQIADSIERKRREITRMRKQLDSMSEEKRQLDRQLEDELARYDSAFVETIRSTEREIATYAERVRSLRQMQRMPAALTSLETEAAALQATIDDLRSQIEAERFRLREADENVGLIAHAFKSILLRIGFPGISERDQVVLDVRNWQPRVVHGDHDWSFWDAGSGGKKTLFNVCYALAVHQVALVKSLPVPNVLVIDSPTKNMSEDEDPELVRNLYSEIYHLARGDDDSFGRVQFLLIDSDLVEPEPPIEGFSHRRMAGEPDAPSLIPYYNGP